MSGVLVVGEARRGALRDITFELLGAAATLSRPEAGASGAAATPGGPIRALVVGDAPVDGLAVDEVLRVDAAHFDPLLQAAAVKAAIEHAAPALVLAPHSIDGMSYAAAVAAELGLGFASDVVAIEEGPVVTRGAYGHRLRARLEFPGAETTLLTVRRGAFEPAAPGAPGAVTALAVEAPAHAVEHLGYQEPEARGADIAQADFLLALGRGAEEAFAELEAIAAELGATVAVSRPLVDEGLASAARQVGQSGRTVKPKVYLALGISGAVQHLAGVRAGTVIAVNTDPKAPIFQSADYGAVADLVEVARELRRQLAS